MSDDRFFWPLIVVAAASYLISYVLIGGELMLVPLQWSWAQTWRRGVAAAIALACTGLAAFALNTFFS